MYDSGGEFCFECFVACKVMMKEKGDYMMTKGRTIFIVVLFILAVTVPVSADNSDLILKIDKILGEGPSHDNYHFTARQVSKWIKMGKNDFLIVDVRIPPEEGKWGHPRYGRIPGSVYIPYTELFKPENLKKLPKDKKIILVGHMNVYENYLVVPLRLLGYDAYILLMGMSGWQKDYPAVGHVNMLIHAPEKMDFPLEKEEAGHMMRHNHKGHKQ